MKIQIDTENKNTENKKLKPHNFAYIFIALIALVFALLYVYGYIEYTR